MRYYRIEIGDITPGSTGPTSVGGATLSKIYTSYVNGQTLAGALHVELDIPVTPIGTPSADSFIKIWGVSIKDIGQVTDLNFKKIKVFGGFQKGLPLANPQQAGLLVQGYIWQALGNWQGTEMSLDLILKTGTPPPAPGQTPAPQNLTLNWKKGQTMDVAIKSALQTAYPGYTVETDITSRLVAREDISHFQGDIVGFAQFLKTISASIINDNKDGSYTGVDVFISENKIRVTDNFTRGDVKAIRFNDIIGQPTWIAPSTVQFKCPMRYDLSIGQAIKFPQANTINSSAAQSSLINQRLTFQGEFQINKIRHVGSFRQSDANSWVTVFDAFAKKPVAANA